MNRLIENIMFLIGSAYFVAGSYPESPEHNVEEGDQAGEADESNKQEAVFNPAIAATGAVVNNSEYDIPRGNKNSSQDNMPPPPFPTHAPFAGDINGGGDMRNDGNESFFNRSSNWNNRNIRSMPVPTNDDFEETI